MDKKIIGTVDVIIKKDDKVLLFHRSKNKRIMPGTAMGPGGKREFNEGAFAAARREVKEETDLEIKNLRVAAVGTSYLEAIDEILLWTVIFCDYASGELRHDLDDGVFKWHTKKEVLALDNLLFDLRPIIPKIFEPPIPTLSMVSASDKNNLMTLCEIEES